MTKEDSTNSSPTELIFYWYECKVGEEHRWYWGQLNSSIHRLGFIQNELNAIKRISDIDLALERLAYHMENYLVRIYELRERAVKLLAVFAGCGIDKIGQLKAKEKEIRENFLKKLVVEQSVRDTYRQLLSLMDDDITLRNQNTHDTFLSLGLYTRHDIFNPQDALIDIQHQQPEMYESFRKRIRQEMRNTIQRYSDKISEIIRLTMITLKQLDYVNR